MQSSWCRDRGMAFTYCELVRAALAWEGLTLVSTTLTRNPGF